IATLIAPQWAVTAAHCTEDAVLVDEMAKPAPRYKVSLHGQDHFIEKIVRYQSEGEGAPTHDIALLRFSAPVTDVAPLPLYDAGDELGRIVVIPGWGTPGTGDTGLGAGDGIFRVAENRVDVAANGRLIWVFDDPRSSLGKALRREG